MIGRILAGAALLALPALAAPLEPQGDIALVPGELTAMLLITDKYREFIATWERPASPDYRSNVSVTAQAVRGQIVDAVVLFANCAAGPGGDCDTVADLKVLKPDGSSYGRVDPQELWKGPAPPRDVLVLGRSHLRIRFEPDDPLGTYRIVARVRDRGAGREIELTRFVELGIAAPAAR